MDNMNDNMHLIGILLLSFILIVVIIYFYRNVMQKHCDIVEEFVSKAQINDGNDYGAGYTDYSEINSLDKNTIENNLIQTRKCQVYFVGAKDRNKAYPLLWREINSDQISKYILLDNSQLSNLIFKNNTNLNRAGFVIIKKVDFNKIKDDVGNININNYVITNDNRYYMPVLSENKNKQNECDALKLSDPNHTCKYEYTDGWLEINKINDNVYDKKIYNQKHTNELTQPAINMCFKENNKFKPRYLYDANENDLIGYNFKGDNTLNSLNIETDKGKGNYITMTFTNNSDAKKNYRNILKNICSLQYNNIRGIQPGEKFLRFNLTGSNNLVKDNEVNVVALNKTYNGFDIIDKKPSFIKSKIYKICFSNYDTTNKKAYFTVFKDPKVKSIKNNTVYGIKYNYLCDKDGKIMELDTGKFTLHLGNLLDTANLGKIPGKEKMQVNVNQLIGFNWDSLKVSELVDQYDDIIKQIESTRNEQVNAIKRRYEQGIEGFTNNNSIEEFQDVNCDTVDWRSTMCSMSEDTILSAPINHLTCYSRQVSSTLGTQLNKESDFLNMKFHDILNVEKEAGAQDPCGRSYSSDENEGQKIYNFIPGFLVTVEEQEEITSIADRYGSIQALNKHGIEVNVDEYFRFGDELSADFNNAKTGMKRVIKTNTNHHVGDVRNETQWGEMQGVLNNSSRNQDLKHNQSLYNIHGSGGDRFTTMVQGLWRPTESRQYRIESGSDDSSWIKIKDMRTGEVVSEVKNFGRHPTWWRSNTSYLQAGKNYIVEGVMSEHYGGQSFHIRNFKRETKKVPYWAPVPWRRYWGYGRRCWGRWHCHNGWGWRWRYRYVKRNRVTTKDTKMQDSLNKWKMRKFALIPGKQLPTFSTWLKQIDGSFTITVTAPGQQELNARSVFFTSRLISEPPIDESGSPEFNPITFIGSKPNYSWTPGLDQSEKDKILAADDYYEYFVKRTSTQQIHFKVKHKDIAIQGKILKVMLGSENANTNDKRITAKGHQKIAGQFNKYYGSDVADGEISRSMPITGILKGEIAYSVAVTGFIFLEKGYYKFNVDDMIDPTTKTVDNSFFIFGSYKSDTENPEYDVKILTNGLYAFSYNIWLYNNKRVQIDISNIASQETNIRTYLNNEESVYMDFDDEKRKKAIELEKLQLDASIGGLRSELDNTVLEDYQRTSIESDIAKYTLELDRLKCYDIELNPGGYVNCRLNQITTFIEGSSADTQTLSLFQMQKLGFNLTANFKSLEFSDITKANVDMKEFCYAGSSLVQLYDDIPDFKNLFANVYAFDDTRDRALADNFTVKQNIEKFNIKEHFYDAAATARKYARTGPNVHNIINIQSRSDKIKNIIDQRDKAMRAEIKLLNDSYNNFKNDLRSQVLQLASNDSFYFNPLVINYRNNIQLTSIINNAATEKDNPSDTDKNEIRNLITYDKIKIIDERTTVDVESLLHDYRFLTTRGIYISAAGIL